MSPGYNVPPVTRPNGCHVPRQLISACIHSPSIAEFFVLALKLFPAILLRRSMHIEGVLTVVEPIPEAVEAILHEVFGCSKVKPRIDCSYISSCLTICGGKA